jgi:hypothetical protein
VRWLIFFLGVISLSPCAFSQGQVVFANRIAGIMDAPVIVPGGALIRGPGSSFAAELYLVGQGGALTALAPATWFYDVPSGATGAQVLADRYILPVVIDVPGVLPGMSATFVMRVWRMDYGGFDADFACRGESAPFAAVVGGGLLPPANLTTLQAFTIGTLAGADFCIVPEPATAALGMVGGLLFLSHRRARKVR